MFQAARIIPKKREAPRAGSFGSHLDPYKKMSLLKGYNDLDYLLSLKEDIAAFEKNRPAFTQI